MKEKFQDNNGLSPKMEKFVDFYCQGYSGVESVKLAGYDSDNYNTLSAIASENLTKPKIKEAISRKKLDLREKFNKEAENAFNTLLEIMNNPKMSGRTRLDAARDLLDRAGYKPSDKVELTGANGRPVEYESRATKEVVSRARTLLSKTETTDVPVIDTVLVDHNLDTNSVKPE